MDLVGDLVTATGKDMKSGILCTFCLNFFSENKTILKKISFVEKLKTDRNRTTKMVHMLKCLPCKHDNVSLTTKNTHKEPSTMLLAIPALKRRQKNPWVHFS